MTPAVVISIRLEGASTFDLVCANQAERDRLSDWICSDDGRAMLVVLAAAVCGAWPDELGFDGEEAESS